VVTELLIICLLIWFPVLLYQIKHRGFVILVIWLFVAPVASNVVNRPQANPFLEISAEGKDTRTVYITGEATIRLRELLEPSRLLFGAYLVVFLLSAVKRSGRPLALDKTEKWMVVFSVVLLASALLQSRRTAFGLHVASDAFVVPFLAYGVARRLVTTEDRFRKLTQVIGWMGVYLIIISIIERLAHADIAYRLRGPFDFRDALYIAMMVVFFTVLIESVGTSSQGQKRVIPYGIQICVLSLAPVIIFLTWTRGPWLGFLLGIWTFAFLGSKLVTLRPKLLALGLLLGLLPVAFLGFQELLGVGEVYSRVANTPNIYRRFATYEVMIEEMSSNPVFGIGLNNMRDVLWEKKRQQTSYGVRAYTVSHNSYLALAGELGAMGLLAYLAILASIFRTGRRVFRMGKHPQECWRGIGVIAIMVAYLIPAAFDTTLYRPWLPPIYVFVYFGGVAGLYDLSRLQRLGRQIQSDWQRPGDTSEIKQKT